MFAYGPADASAIPISPSSLASFKSRSVSQLMPLPLTVSCFSKIQIGFTFLVPAYPGSPGKGCVCVCACVCGFTLPGCPGKEAVKQAW